MSEWRWLIGFWTLVGLMAVDIAIAVIFTVDWWQSL